jgi:predicted kinase
MKTFKEYLTEEEILLEKLITFGGKAYPKFGNVVILAGGAGSGKGFVKDNLIGLEGIGFDVDELKKMAIQSVGIRKTVKTKLGIDLQSLDLKNSEHVGTLHDVIGDYLNLPNKRTETVYRSILTADPERKPNLIFDVTLKNMKKLADISRQIQRVGYAKENIHIVWIVNDIEIAQKQNKERDRRVPAEILIDTHRGVSQTMRQLVDDESALAKYMNGDLVFAFNKIKVDSELAVSGKGGKYIKDSNYVYIKRRGQAPLGYSAISGEMRKKIASYVPKNVSWD